MTVTLGIYGATDATGWTTFEPMWEPGNPGFTDVAARTGLTSQAGAGVGTTGKLFDGVTAVYNGANSRILYVAAPEGADSSGPPYGSNSTGDGTEAHPYATIAYAAGKMRSDTTTRADKADWILMKRGDTFRAGFTYALAGRSADNPVLVSAYGSGNRPRFVMPLATATSSPATWWDTINFTRYVAVTDLDFYWPRRAPPSESGTAIDDWASIENPAYWVRVNSPYHWMLIENCRAAYQHDTALLVPTAELAGPEHSIFRRNVVWSPYFGNGWTGGNSIGLYFNAPGTQTFRVEENIFWQCGWNNELWAYWEALLGAGNNSRAMRNDQDHSIYNSGLKPYQAMSCKGNLFIRTGGNLIRGGSSVKDFSDNFILGNCGNICDGGTTNATTPHDPPWDLSYNVFLHGENWADWNTMSPRRPFGVAKGLQIRHGCVNTTLHKNLFLHKNSGAALSIYSIMVGDTAAGLNGACTGIDARDNINYKCKVNITSTAYAAFYCANTSTPSTFSNGTNIADPSNLYLPDGLPGGQTQFPDPERTIITYATDILGSSDTTITDATLTLSALLRDQERDNWDTTLMAPAINDYFRAGFGLVAEPPPIVAPSVTTAAAQGVDYQAATLVGTVGATGGAAITERGFVYGLSANPVVGVDSEVVVEGGLGNFTANITGLSDLTTYHYRAYATNSAGTGYGLDVTFDTLEAPTVMASVTTSAVGTITNKRVVMNGNVTSDGGNTVTARGFCYSATDAVPSLDDSVATVSGTTGAYSVSVAGLTPNTQYWMRAYATTSVGTAYGAVVTFVTKSAYKANLRIKVRPD